MKRLFLGIIPLLLVGCATSNYSYKNNLRKNNGYEKRATTQTTKKSNFSAKKQLEVKKDRNRFTLNINTKPANTKIRILNIKPKFYNGIELKRGKYLIEATKPGYSIYKKWVMIDKDSTINIVLKKMEQNFKPNGEITWKAVKLPSKYSKYSMNLILDKHIGYAGNTIFYMSDYALSWYEAKRFCNKLDFKGLKWRLPTRSEKKRCLKVRKFYNYHSSDIVTNKKSHYPNDKRKFICIAYPNSIKDSYSLNKTAQDIYNNIAKKILGSKYKVPKKPVKPEISGFKPPKKDEFETSGEYKKRVEKFKAAYRHKKEVKLKEYAKKLKKWKKEDKKARQRHTASIEKFKKLKNAGMLYSLQQALYIKYGTPVIRNLKYNADKEEFEMDIVSSRLNEIYFKEKNRLKNASKGKKDKVYITKNGIVLDYIISSAWWYNRGVILSNLNDFEHVALSKKAVVSNLLKFANKNLKDGSHIWIFIPNNDSSRGIYKTGDILLDPSGKYERGHHTFYYDPSIKSDTSIVRGYYYKKHINIKVPRKYAKLFKKAVLNNSKFTPNVVFNIRNGNLDFRYIKEFKHLDRFLDFLVYDDARNDPSKLKRYIATHKNSKYYTRAKKRYAVLNRFYKGYEPKIPFFIEGCKGYYPVGLISKVAKKAFKNKKDAKDLTPDFWEQITWSGLCRKGLLSGRGYLKMTAKKGNLYIDFSDGFMKNGFFIGDVEVELHKHIRGAFWGGSTIKENVRLKSYKDFVNYQKGF